MVNLVKSKAQLYVDNFNPEVFKEEMTLADSGVDSLALVEIVASVVKDLNIKIPRTELGNVKTIGELINVLLDQANQNT